MPILNDSELARRAMDLEWILCDVDGVLTDGGLFYTRWGHLALRFDVRDGLGFKLAQMAGLKVGLLSGRSSAAVDRRAAELKLEVVHQGILDKGAELNGFLERHKTVARRLAYIGDDIPDLVVLGQCGLSFAPADAVPEVRTVVHRVLSTAGGRGAVREMVEIILRARGDWDHLYSQFTFDS